MTRSVIVPLAERNEEFAHNYKLFGARRARLLVFFWQSHEKRGETRNQFVAFIFIRESQAEKWKISNGVVMLKGGVVLAIITVQLVGN